MLDRLKSDSSASSGELISMVSKLEKDLQDLEKKLVSSKNQVSAL
jgi:hypothetical protein